MSADAARRTALAAQGFGRPRPNGRVTRQHLRRVFDDVGQIQIDSVNVLVRSQELPLFARLGPHPRSLIPDAVAAGELFEYWAHAASLLPTRHYPLYRWRMERARNGEGWFESFTARKRHLVDSVLEQVRERGPLAVGDLHGRVRNKGGTWWDWDDGKIALEALFDAGHVGATRRSSDFARMYDLSERLIPTDVLAVPPVDVALARKELVVLAARSLGVATVADLADYHYQRVAVVKTMVDELVSDGRLVPIEVDGWAKPAFLHPEARTPRAITGRALLSPFDTLVRNRDRTERIFDFNYRIEIYTPAPKRIYGYYVLPFLLDGQLVGRVDLKADRQAGVLRVQAAHVEPDLDNTLDRPGIAEALALELHDMAGWLGLGTVGVTDRGSLAADLASLAGVERLAS
jgi:uncharacterized protein YcaQ